MINFEINLIYGLLMMVGCDVYSQNYINKYILTKVTTFVEKKWKNTTACKNSSPQKNDPLQNHIYRPCPYFMRWFFWLEANELPFRNFRDDEFDLDLEDIMVMEAIWLSIQVNSSNINCKTILVFFPLIYCWWNSLPQCILWH